MLRSHTLPAEADITGWRELCRVRVPLPNPADYYPAGKRWNAFAKIFHDYGIEKYAYGFPYDDVTSQSSVRILGNAAPPSKLTITIGW